MAIVNFTGFETGDFSEGALSGTGSIQTTVKRTGSYALRINPATTGAGSASIYGHNADGIGANFSIANLFLTVYFRYATKPSSNSEEIMSFQSGLSTLEGTLRLNSDGTLSIYAADGTTLHATGTAVLAANTWYRLEVNWNNTANTQEVKVDGTVDISGTITISANLSRVHLGKRANRNGNTVDYFYDDACVSDSAYPGAGEVKIAVPIGAGAASGWDDGTGTTFAEVDEIPPGSDGTTDTSYIGTDLNGDNQDHTFDMQSWATIGGAGDIGAVKTMVLARTDSTTDTSSVAHRRLFNGSGFELTARELVTTYQLYAKIDETDPSGSGAITSADFDSIEVGMAANTIAQTQRFTVAYLTVWSAGAAAGLAKIVNDTIQLPESIQRPMSLRRMLAETIQIVESQLRRLVLVRVLNSIVEVSSSLFRQMSLIRNLLDVVQLSEEILRRTSLSRFLSSTVNITESVTRAFALKRIFASTIEVSDYLLRVIALRRIFNDTTQVLEQLSTDVQSYIRKVFSDTVQLIESLSRRGSLLRIATETLQVSEIMLRLASLRRLLNETVQVSEHSLFPQALLKIIVESVQVVENVLRNLSLIRGFSDVVSVSENFLRFLTLRRMVFETAEIVEIIRRPINIRRYLAEVVQAEERLLRVRSLIKLLADAVHVLETLSHKINILRVLDETLQVVETVLVRGYFVKIFIEIVQATEVRTRILWPILRNTRAFIDRPARASTVNRGFRAWVSDAIKSVRSR